MQTMLDLVNVGRLRAAAQPKAVLLSTQELEQRLQKALDNEYGSGYSSLYNSYVSVLAVYPNEERVVFSVKGKKYQQFYRIANGAQIVLEGSAQEVVQDFKTINAAHSKKR